jgi:hypothetical protein
MTIRTGLLAQLGLAEESTYGTYVAPTRFLEFLNESLSLEIERLESAGLRAGQRVLRSDRWASGAKTVGGDVAFEVQTTGLGLLLEHAFGGVSTTNPLGSAYEHTFTPGDLPVGLSLQVGRPSIDGTVRPFSYLGSRITDFSIAGNVGEIGQMGVTFACQDEDTGESLGSATYPSNSLLTFVEASVEIASSAVPARSFELTGNNGLATGRTVLGSQLMAEPLEGTGRMYEGTIDAHYVDLTAYNRFVAGTEAELVAKFEGAEIETSYPFALEITANIRTDGETPQVSGPDEIPQNLGYKVVDAGSGGISVVYRTTDATP